MGSADRSGSGRKGARQRADRSRGTLDEWEVVFRSCLHSSQSRWSRWGIDREAGAGLGKGREQAGRQVGGAGTGRGTVDDQEVVFEKVPVL